MPTVLKETGESEARVYRKFTAAIEIGRHYTGYGYSTKDEMGTVVPAGSSDNMKILSAVWYNSRDDETKIGYDAQDEFLKDHENPPEYVSYAADLSFVFDQVGEILMNIFMKFCLLFFYIMVCANCFSEKSQGIFLFDTSSKQKAVDGQQKS